MVLRSSHVERRRATGNVPGYPAARISGWPQGRRRKQLRRPPGQDRWHDRLHRAAPSQTDGRHARRGPEGHAEGEFSMTDEADNTASVPPGASTSSGTTPPPEPPPWSPGPSFSRQHLVRPRQGRYVAGVCAALARATNTDPVLWRVLVAVLGVLSGVGVLLYLIGWLIIPAEGDTASPIEGLLGKGRSGMAPLTVVVLGAAAVISFGFIVHDGMRASLLAAAVIVGAVLLIKRNGGSPAAPPDPGQAATFPPPADPVPPADFP